MQTVSIEKDKPPTKNWRTIDPISNDAKGFYPKLLRFKLE